MKKETYFMAFPETLILPTKKTATSVITTSQIPFKPYRLVIDQNEGVENIFVCDIRFGPYSKFLNHYEASARFFPPLPDKDKNKEILEELEKNIEFGTVQISQQVILFISNRGKKVFKLNAMMWGIGIEEK